MKPSDLCVLRFLVVVVVVVVVFVVVCRCCFCLDVQKYEWSYQLRMVMFQGCPGRTNLINDCSLQSLQGSESKIEGYTPEINMEHNHGGLEDHFPF